MGMILAGSLQPLSGRGVQSMLDAVCVWSRSSTRYLAFAGGVAISLVFGNAAQAVPTLQLNIVDGIYHDGTFGPAGYESGSETVTAGGERFTLQAYARAKQNALSSGDIAGVDARTFYLGVALVPGPDYFAAGAGNSVGSAGNFGSFDVSYTDANGLHVDTIDATSELTFGTPLGLSPHGIYGTYHTELAFEFAIGNTSEKFNSQDEAGREAVFSATGDMHFQNFVFDTGNLDPNYELHFDLYVYDCSGASCTVDLFAPFSHDAMSWPPTEVSEPGNLGVFATGLIGFGLAWRRRRRREVDSRP